MLSGLRRTIHSRTVLQRIWVVVTVLWFGVVVYIVVLDFPTESRIQSRAFIGNFQVKENLRKELERAEQQCDFDNPKTQPFSHVGRLTCGTAAKKVYYEEMKSAKENSERILHVELDGLVFSQFIAILKLLALGLVLPLFLYWAVWWITKDTLRKPS